MKNIGSIVNGLRFVLKYAVYITAAIKIVEFAIETIESIPQTEEEKKTKLTD